MDDVNLDEVIAQISALEQAQREIEAERDQLARKLMDTEVELRRRTMQMAHAERLARLGYWCADLRNNRVLWSEGLSQLLGVSPEPQYHPLGAIYQFVHPDDRARIARAVDDAMKTRSIYVVDFRAYRDGEEHKVRICGEFEFDSAGEPVANFGVGQDLTGREQAKKDLRESQDRHRQLTTELELIYRTAPIGLCVLDQDLRFVHINERLAEINGVPVEDHLGKTVSEVVPDVALHNEALLRDVLETGEPVIDFELTAETPARPGVHRTWLSQYWPLRRDDGKIYGINVVAEEITERRWLEEFRTLAENSTDMIVRFDRALRRIYVNAAFEHLLGKPRTALLNKSNHEIGLPDELAAFLDQVLEQVFLTGHAQTVEVNLPTAAGLRVVESRVVPEFGPDRQVETLLAISRDITERKQAEQSLRENERKYREVVENLYEGIWIIDENDNTTLVNQRMTELLGFSAEEMLGRNLFTFMDAQAMEAAKNNLARGRGGMRAEYEFCFRHKNGAQVFTHIVTAPLYDTEGHYRGALAGVTDITERKRTEEILHRRQQEFEALSERSPDVIARVDGAMRIRYINRAVERLTGKPRDWFLGKRPAELRLAPRESTLREEVLQRAFATGQEQMVEHEHPMPGGMRYFQSRVVPEFGASGEVESVLVVDRDITELKRAQFALESLTLHDPLTQIPNRRYLEQFIGREWGREARHQHPVALIMADIDHFKAYNDHYGHQQGDDCLRQVAHALRSCLRRPSDFLVRYGGEEFLVVLVETEAVSASLLADTMRRRVLERALPHAASPVAPVVTISLGVAGARADRFSFATLLSMADQALYDAKRNGRNRIESMAAPEPPA
jgi:diguanylate cyclase (GGDEF)-like protein/PAS domain S-box-containing protein